MRTRCRPGDGGDSACLRNEALYAIGERGIRHSRGLVKSLLNSAIDRLRPMGRAAAHEPAGPAPIIDAREEMPL